MSQRIPKLLIYLTLLLLGGGLLSPLISYATLTLDSTSLTSDGALTVKSASSSITLIGETNQTGAITVASSSETLTLNLGTGTGATTVNIATGATNAKTVNIATSASLLHFINVGSASTTVNLPGNLGVGITSPSTTLHLSGTFRFVNGNQGAAKSLFSDASGNATWQTATTTLTYNEATSTVTTTQTTEANATQIVAASAYTFDGSTPVSIEFFAPTSQLSSNNDMSVWLYDGASSIGRLAVFNTPATRSELPIYLVRRLTPSAASHTYSIRFTIGGGTAASMSCGEGGAGNIFPCYIKISSDN